MIFFYEPLHKDKLVWQDMQEPIYNSFKWTQDVIWKTDCEQWLERERESGKFMLTAQLEDEHE